MEATSFSDSARVPGLPGEATPLVVPNNKNAPFGTPAPVSGATDQSTFVPALPVSAMEMFWMVLEPAPSTALKKTPVGDAEIIGPTLATNNDTGTMAVPKEDESWMTSR